MPRPIAAVLLLGLVAQLTPVVTASAQPARNGNVYNGTAHQPSQGAVQDKEQSAGVSPSAGQQRTRTDEVEQLNRQLQNAENKDPLVHPNGAGQVAPH